MQAVATLAPGSVDPGETTGRSDAGGGWSAGGPGSDRLSLEPYLRNSHGFLVDTTQGREVGIVDEVVIDATTGRVVQIEVCGGWFGRTRRTIAPEQVEGIDPLTRRVVVSANAVRDARR